MSKAYGYVRCCPNVPAIMTASIASQTEAVIRATAVRGLYLRRVFVDISTGSGVGGLCRHMLDKAGLDNVTAVVVPDLARLTRTTANLDLIIDELQSHGIDLVRADREDISDESYAFAWSA